MSKPFDATLKTLVETYPEDWLAQAGIVSNGDVEIIEAELSTITTAADKIIRVNAPVPQMVHVEMQSGPDPNLHRRVLLYNVLVFERYSIPVHSIVVLLRPDADIKSVTGELRYASPLGGNALEFHYQVMRVWQEPVELFLNGGLGILPLAPMSDVSAQQLPDIVKLMSERLDQEASPANAESLWTASYILAGCVTRSRLSIRCFEE